VDQEGIEEKPYLGIKNLCHEKHCQDWNPHLFQYGPRFTVNGSGSFILCTEDADHEIFDPLSPSGGQLAEGSALQDEWIAEYG
jgi:hypothetical protein